MNRHFFRLLAAVPLAAAMLVVLPSSARACQFFGECPETELDDGGAVVHLTTEQAGKFAGGDIAVADYQWQLRSLCEISNEIDGTCSPSDFRPCPEELGRVFEFLVLEQRVVVRP